MYHIFFIHSSVIGHLGSFNVLTVVNSAPVNFEVHVPFQVMVFSRCMPRSGVAGSYGSSIFSFLRDHHIIIHNVCTNSQGVFQSVRPGHQIPAPSQE